ncbi:MAG: 2-hydroxychromene-2-carboxylate isomerase [Pseudomonadota bacterium]
MAQLEFWFDFGSTYSYLTARRIEREAEAAGVEIVWRPFLLGPIFQAAGWQSSPFLEQPQKLDYMWRDVARQAEAYGFRFAKPDPFPANGVYAARVALVAAKDGFEAAWCRRVFRAVFCDGLDIAQADVLAGLLEDVGRDAERVLARSGADDIKRQLRAQTEEAARRGIFGAPTFIAEDGELFWGDDRLALALAWASGQAVRPASNQ